MSSVRSFDSLFEVDSRCQAAIRELYNEYRELISEEEYLKLRKYAAEHELKLPVPFWTSEFDEEKSMRRTTAGFWLETYKNDEYVKIIKELYDRFGETLGCFASDFVLRYLETRDRSQPLPSPFWTERVSQLDCFTYRRSVLGKEYSILSI